MANSTFIGFNFPSSATTSYTDSQVVREIQPITTWNRDGGYTVTRRWRGPIDSLVAFSDGGASNKDFAWNLFHRSKWHSFGWCRGEMAPFQPT